MIPISPSSIRRASYELRFRPLHPSGGEFAFDCSAAGRVDLDTLSRPALNRYLYARALVGRSFARPAVCPRGADAGGSDS